MNFKQNEEAVSPVIGVILMVAITVILAAVIAAFVFGMTGNVQTTKIVAATAQQQGSNITITYQGGADAGDVLGLNYSIGEKGLNSFPNNKTGASVSNSTGVTPGKDHVIVIALFTDGSEQVVLDTYI